jgi:ABC-type multidrug transport system ATPase subunit
MIELRTAAEEVSNVKIIEAHHLTKPFQNQPVIRNVSLSVSEGDTYGICGKSGSGKTTLLHLLHGTFSPSSGQVFLFDRPAVNQSVLHRLGMYTGETRLYHHLNEMDHLMQFSKKYKQPADKARCIELLRAVHLQTSADVRVEDDTNDMKKRLLLAQAAAHDPDILFFDESFSGLDQSSTHAAIELIEIRKQQKKTIIIASSQLDEISDLCPVIAILQKGIIMKEGSKDELFRAYGHSIRASFKLSHADRNTKN